jgi:hypothetical protein
MDYLRFAYGEGIGPPQEVDLDPLVGLEHVAQLVKAAPAKCDPPSIGATTRTRDKDVECFSQNLEALSVEDPIHSSQGGATYGMDLSVEKEDPAEVSSDSCSPTTPHPDETDSDPSYSYGAVSDKIGEACVCWLAKWGADLLVYEQRAAGLEQSASVAPVATPPRAISRRSTVSSWRTPNSDTTHSSHPRPPLIWRRGGLTAAWVRALISSDMLFIEGEKERYNLAKNVVELRRNEGILEEEEVEWGKMFTEGIYYANLVRFSSFLASLALTLTYQSFDDLVYVAHDRSPTTGRPYVPERVLRAAYWTQSMLRHKIVGPQSSSPSASPESISRHKELGISRSQKDIKEVLLHPDMDEENCAYWPIPSPSSMRIGEYADVGNLATDELFGLSSTARRHVPGRSLMSASNFFGLKNDRCTATECVLDGSSSATRWIPYPPYRFAVEFWDVNSLREKSHLYSQTIWYAGSLFNVFVQVFRKKAKDPQLGVYLHRQSSIDPVPPLSVPFEPISADNSADSPASPPALSSPPSLTVLTPHPTEYSDSGLPVVDTPRATTPVQGSPLNSSTSGSSLPATGQPIVPSQPYRDPRAQLSAYFTISCSSATGSSATRFASNPDDFTISQSWGWRSSSLWTEVCFKDKDEKVAGPSTPSLSGDMRSMRITVVLGVV